MLTSEGVTAVKSSTVDHRASLDWDAIQGMEIADICMVLTVCAQVWARTTPKSFLGARAAKKRGRSSPLRCFALAQISQRLAQVFLIPRVARLAKVNARVNDRVDRMFGASFTWNTQKTMIKCGDSRCERRENFAIVWQFLPPHNKPLSRRIRFCSSMDRWPEKPVSGFRL